MVELIGGAEGSSCQDAPPEKQVMPRVATGGQAPTLPPVSFPAPSLLSSLPPSFSPLCVKHLHLQELPWLQAEQLEFFLEEQAEAGDPLKPSKQNEPSDHL